MVRNSGILMHISSLPSPYGIGTMGQAAYDFVDFLKAAGQTRWQVLPLGQTGLGDSPYQSCSTYAGNPYFIDLDILKEEGYLTDEDLEGIDWGDSDRKVDFGKMYANRYPVLRKAFEVFSKNLPEDYDAFCWEQGQWLEDYALFMAIKTEKNGASWDSWEDGLRMRYEDAIAEAKSRLGMEMFFWKMVQYLFFRQWHKLRAYANTNGIRIIGDLPIYVAKDSADVWSNPYQFDLNEKCEPVEVAGCPPDYFSPDGQLWGNPLFRWDRMQQDRYSWWMNRIRHMLRFFDIIRIDHFRGFESYFCIPYGDTTARNGYWRQGPSVDFFRVLREELGNVPIIAEDLGLLTPAVRNMLQYSGYPGMKVLQFAFDGSAGNEYLPHNYPDNCVAYTGTHDNDTNVGWLRSATDEQKAQMIDILGLSRKEGYNWGMLRAIWSSSAKLAIAAMQDVLSLPGTARMNQPSTMGSNWAWRVSPDYRTETLEQKLRLMTERYNRQGGDEEVFWGNPFPVPVGQKLPVPEPVVEETEEVEEEAVSNEEVANESAVEAEEAAE